MIHLLGYLFAFITLCFLIYKEEKGTKLHDFLISTTLTEVAIFVFLIGCGWWAFFFVIYYFLDEKYKLRIIHPFEKIGNYLKYLDDKYNQVRKK